MSALAFYANTLLWIGIVAAFERRGSVRAHKIRVCLSQDWSCRCLICHPVTPRAALAKGGAQ